jgi:hypothetical protein
MYKLGQDNNLHRFITMEETQKIFRELCEGIAWGHFATYKTTKKILNTNINGQYCSRMQLTSINHVMFANEQEDLLDIVWQN